MHRRVTPSSKFAGTHLYTWVERGTMRVKCLAQEHNTAPWPGLEPGPPDPESSALAIRPPRLPQTAIYIMLSTNCYLHHAATCKRCGNTRKNVSFHRACNSVVRQANTTTRCGHQRMDIKIVLYCKIITKFKLCV